MSGRDDLRGRRYTLFVVGLFPPMFALRVFMARKGAPMLSRSDPFRRLISVMSWLVIASVGFAQPATPPAGGDKPAETAKPAAPAGAAPAVSSPFEPFFAAAKEKFPADWVVQRKALSPKELQAVLEADLDTDGKALCKKIEAAEVMAANHPSERQVCVVQIVKFPEPKQASQYLDLLHMITKSRFEKADGKKGATVEITDDKLNLFGPDSTRRLVIKTTQYGRSSHQFINRFTLGQHFVEVSSIVAEAEKAMEKPVTEALINAIRAKQ